MGTTYSILDLSAWASELGPVFRKALDPATSIKSHRDLAEQATECLEQCALLGDRGLDGAAPWRALLVGDECFVALEDGFALARFDASNLLSLRVDTFDGRRWAVLHTGRGLAAFRQAALGKGTGAGADPLLKVAAFGEHKLRFSRIFHPNGGETEEPGVPAAQNLAQGLALPVDFGPVLPGSGAVLMRRALEHRDATREVPGTSVVAAAEPSPTAPRPVPEPLPASPIVPPAPESAPPPAAAPAKWQLLGMTANIAGRIIPVAASSVLGRDPGAEILVDNLTVSRRHAEVRPTPLGMVLKDLGSANGTWFERARLDGPVLLKSGDTFTLGECVFRVERL